jgi:hypothetical protein
MYAAVRLLGLEVRIPPMAWILSLLSVVCFQVEVSALDWSPVQRSPTEYGVSVCDREVSKMGKTQSIRAVAPCKVNLHIHTFWIVWRHCILIFTPLRLHLIYFWPEEVFAFLGAFAKLRKVTMSFVSLSARLFVCPRGTTRLPLDGFSGNLIFWAFFENLCSKLKFH